MWVRYVLLKMLNPFSRFPGFPRQDDPFLDLLF
jgi:hypothetical protein